MDPDVEEQPASTCTCSCTCCSCLCCGPSQASMPIDGSPRPLKRNYSEMTTISAGIARVELENEAAALREALARHQQTILDLCTELEAERNSSATATTEALSMILRLQREKADVQIEATQFKRFAEEKMAHDQQDISEVEEMLFKKDQALQSLSCEIQAYKHRLLSYGILDINPNASEPNTPHNQFDTPPPMIPPARFDYPPLRCKITAPPHADDEQREADKYPFGEAEEGRTETPKEHLQKIEQRICQLEKLPSNVMEKGVVVRQSLLSPRYPHRPRRRFSSSFNSFGSGSASFANQGDEFPVAVDRPSNRLEGDGETSDRIYTVRVCGGDDSYASTPRELGVGLTTTKTQHEGGIEPGLGTAGQGGGMEQEEIRKLQTRLQALEADRESMRKTLINMSTDKAQMVLLREIAQQICRDNVAPEKKIIKRPPPPKAKSFSIMSVIKVKLISASQSIISIFVILSPTQKLF
jgi:Zein-binding